MDTTETELREYFECSDEHLNTLELPELRRIWPALQKKEEEVRKLLEKHAKEQARLEQLIAMVTLKKKELDEKIAKQTSIYTALGGREIQVDQEMAKIQTTIPYYEHMVYNMFSGLQGEVFLEEETN